MKHHRLTVRLDDDAMVALKAQAELRDVPLETMLDQVITAGLFFKGLITLRIQGERKATER